LVWGKEKRGVARGEGRQPLSKITPPLQTKLSTLLMKSHCLERGLGGEADKILFISYL
jgi:hypothetical protein